MTNGIPFCDIVERASEGALDSMVGGLLISPLSITTFAYLQLDQTPEAEEMLV